MDIRQFAYAGIDVYGLLANYLGKTTQEVKDMDISFEDLSGALIQAGQQGGKYYGAMESMSDTLTGKTAKLKVQIETLLISLTESLLPVVQKIVDKISEWIDKFNQLDPETKEMITNALLFVGALGPVLTIVGKIITTIGTIAGGLSKLSSIIGQVSASATASGTSLSALAGPIGIVIGVISGLVAEFVHLFKTNEEFNAKVMEAWNNIVIFFQEHVMPIWNQLVTLIKNVFETIWGAIQQIWSYIEPYIAEIFTALVDWWNETGHEIFDAVADILNFLLEGINWLWTNIIDPLIKILIQVLKPEIDFLFTTISTAFKMALQMITDWWNSVKGIFNGIVEFLEGVFTGNWEKAWNGIKNVFKSIVEGLVNIFKTPLNAMIDLINKFINGINKIKIPDWVPRSWRNDNWYSKHTKISKRWHS